MNQNQTSSGLIFLVVSGIAALAVIGMSTIAYCTIYEVAADPQMSTAMLTLTSGLVGALTGLLANTRTQSTGASGAVVESTQTTTTTTKAKAIDPAIPVEAIPVNVQNTEPIPVEDKSDT